jgi:RNA polymerase sigma-70 factor, ECF subfamily
MTADAKTARLKGFDASRADETDQPFDRELVREALVRLHPSHREVILKAYYLQWTTRQIAADLNITEPAVKCLLHHAVRTLRRALSDSTR